MPQLNFGENRSSDEDINIIGPKEGYSPQIGTLVSMLTWMRRSVLRSVEKLNQQELDFRFDPNSNTIRWLMKVDPKFFGGMPTNNYCKWFHVCEHESNHNGRIKWLAKRLPGAKPGNELNQQTGNS
jgi:uncharacterized membrane protein